MGSTRLDASLLKMEAEPAAETLYFFKNKIDYGQSPKQGDSVSEKFSCIREGMDCRT